MPITNLEDAQRLRDLRTKMLSNVAAGKPSWDGITEEEMKRALDLIRSGRAEAGAAGAAAKAKKAKMTKAPKEPGEAAKKLADLVGDLDLD